MDKIPTAVSKAVGSSDLKQIDSNRAEGMAPGSLKEITPFDPNPHFFMTSDGTLVVHYNDSGREIWEVYDGKRWKEIYSNESNSIEETPLSRFPWTRPTGFHASFAKGQDPEKTLVKNFPVESFFRCFIGLLPFNEWKAGTGRGGNRGGVMVDTELFQERDGKVTNIVYHNERHFNDESQAAAYVERMKSFIDGHSIQSLRGVPRSGKMSMSKFESKFGVWPFLESLFRESRQYRGDNSIRLVDLRKLVEAIADGGELRSGAEVNMGPDKKPVASLDPNGGLIECLYGFDPSIWGKWFPSQDLALSMAAMDKDVTAQYAGRSQGGTVHKTTWGGKVANVPGKARSDFERMPSAMDRYDVLMQGEVGPRAKVNKRTGQTTTVNVGTLLRLAYSPSIGSTEERKARLLALISGHAVPALKRRPQPHVPEPSRKEAEWSDQTNPPAQAVRRVGQNIKGSGEEGDDDTKAPAGKGQRDRDRPDFSQFLSKHGSAYQPQAKKARTAEDDAEDALAALFSKKK